MRALWLLPAIALFLSKARCRSPSSYTRHPIAALPRVARAPLPLLLPTHCRHCYSRHRCCCLLTIVAAPPWLLVVAVVVMDEPPLFPFGSDANNQSSTSQGTTNEEHDESIEDNQVVMTPFTFEARDFVGKPNAKSKWLDRAYQELQEYWKSD